MDNKKFLKYMRGAIATLFPDALDQPGCHILLKVNSGPGRMNLELLASLKLLGIILYPCIPNTMHMMQEMDQCYDPFKTQFLKNLDMIVEARVNNSKSLLIALKMVGLPLFGGIDWETVFEVETGAFQHPFVPSQCKAAWTKVGAAMPNGITRACLGDLQVMKELGDSEDMYELYKAIQMANDLAIHALTLAGYNAQWLQATLKKKEVEELICVPNTVTH